MRILGIDPGSLVTGYGVVDKQRGAALHVDNGIIKPRASLSFARRLHYIHENIIRLIGEFKPDVIALEDVFVAKNVKSAIKLGHVRGIAMLAAVSTNLEIAEYPPAQVKQAIVGTGTASKDQVQKMVKAILKLPQVAAEDAADALAVAICHLQFSTLRDITKLK